MFWLMAAQQRVLDVPSVNEQKNNDFFWLCFCFESCDVEEMYVDNTKAAEEGLQYC